MQMYYNYVSDFKVLLFIYKYFIGPMYESLIRTAAIVLIHLYFMIKVISYNYMLHFERLRTQAL